MKDRLKELRQVLKMNQTEFGKRIGLNKVLLPDMKQVFEILLML